MLNIPSPAYVAGPMCGLRDLNFPAFDHAAQWLESEGIPAINPAQLDRDAGIDPADGDPEGHREIARRDLTEITLRAKSLVILPGWETSKGTAAEIATAHWLGLPIYYLLKNAAKTPYLSKKPCAAPTRNPDHSRPPKNRGPRAKASPSDIVPCFPDTKDTNPKDACGSLKSGISCVPMNVLSEVGLALTEGSKKYGSHNYRKAGVRASIYIDALWRHVFLQWWDQGQDNDQESDCSHITKGIACLVVLRDAMMNNMLTDDRPIRSSPVINELNAKAKDLTLKNPNPVPPFTQIQQTRIK